MNRILVHTLTRQAMATRSAYIASPLRRIGSPLRPLAK